MRSGKTTDIILAFCRHLETLTTDGLHLAFAESIALARLILMEGGNGLGIYGYFRENAREGQYKGKDALYIKIRNTTQIVIFVGSKNSDAFKSIRGLTIKSVIGTEVNLAHRSFLEEAVARTLATPLNERRLFFDLNPTIDSHYIYVDFVDRWVKEAKEGKLIGGVNYMTCSLYENPALTPEQAEVIVSQYDQNSPFYKALILGMRVNSADVVYLLYDYNYAATQDLNFIEYIIVVDVGISSSATTFITMGLAEDHILYITDAYYHRNGKSSVENVKEYDDYGNDLIEFYNKQTARHGKPPRYVFIDRDISMLRILTRKFLENNIPKSVLSYAIKEKIEERITNTRNLLYLGSLVIENELEDVKRAFINAVYDSKEVDKGKLIRLDNTNLEFNPIDIIDPSEYAVSYFLKYRGDLIENRTK